MTASGWKRYSLRNPATVTLLGGRTNRPSINSTQARSTPWRNLLTRSNRPRHLANEHFALEARRSTPRFGRTKICGKNLQPKNTAAVPRPDFEKLNLLSSRPSRLPTNVILFRRKYHAQARGA